jgi:hypothetical protein
MLFSSIMDRTPLHIGIATIVALRVQRQGDEEREEHGRKLWISNAE